AIEDSQVEISLGNTASFSIIEEDPIPSSWKEVVNKILSNSGRLEVAVLGGVDSGKTSFCTYLANVALNNGYKVAIVDGDLGQSDIGPPGTLGLSLMRKSVIDLVNLPLVDAVFIGNRSPYNVVEEVISGLLRLKDKAVEMGSDLIIINTDGWVDGAEAIRYKCKLISSLRPKFTAIMKGDESLNPLINSLAGSETLLLIVETPKNVKKRDREARKIIRETLYRRYLKDAKIRTIPISWIKICGGIEIDGKVDQSLRKRFEETLGNKIVYCKNVQGCIVLVLREGSMLSEDEKIKLVSAFNMPIKIMHEGDEKGLLVSLEDNEGRFLGIGVINSIDYGRGVLKIYTNVNGAVSRVCVGQIRLDEKGSEIDFNKK
ncbi:MAG: Clp1/GlmU family protein, partial [Candidatus Bathyarchaeota archaeon]|nr:Clp1/GlmU family protein [Candidatus Bathyarchaeota archaeon]